MTISSSFKHPTTYLQSPVTQVPAIPANSSLATGLRPKLMKLVHDLMNPKHPQHAKLYECEPVYKEHFGLKNFWGGTSPDKMEILLNKIGDLKNAAAKKTSEAWTLYSILKNELRNYAKSIHAGLDTNFFIKLEKGSPLDPHQSTVSLPAGFVRSKTNEARSLLMVNLTINSWFVAAESELNLNNPKVAQEKLDNVAKAVSNANGRGLKFELSGEQKARKTRIEERIRASQNK